MQGSRRRPRRELLAVVAVMLIGLSACSGKPAATSSSAPPAPARAVRTKAVPVGALPVAERDQYIKLDLDLAPPEDLARVVKLPADVENHTAGKIDDATFKKWAEAAMRESIWEVWAVENLQSNFLSHLSPGESEIDDWGIARDWIQAAKDKHAKLTAGYLVEKMVLVPVLPSTQARLHVLGQPASEYAWVLTVAEGSYGPTRLTYADGRTEVLYSIGAGVHRNQMLGGRLKTDLPVVGPFWFQESSYECTGTYMRPTCAQ